MDLCIIEGCQKPKRSKNALYCHMHYSRWKRYGRLTAARVTNSAELTEQFLRGFKTCARCRQVKPLTDFNPHTRELSRKYAYCKLCKRDSIFISKYGISLREYERMFEAQNGKCLICNRTPEQMSSQNIRYKMLNVDHNHTTGTVRGLICSDCNIGISRFHDDVCVLANAIRYLNQH